MGFKDWNDRGITRYETDGERKKRVIGAGLALGITALGVGWILLWNAIVDWMSLGDTLKLPALEVIYGIASVAAAGIIAILVRMTYMASFTIMASMIGGVFAVSELWLGAFISLGVVVILQVIDQFTYFFRRT